MRSLVQRRLYGNSAPLSNVFIPKHSQRLRPSNKRAGYRLYALAGLVLLLIALLVLPIAPTRSSAQEQERAGERAASPSYLTPNAAAAPTNDTCAGAIPLALRQSVDGTLAAATDDYELSGAACFTGIGQTVTTADGLDVVYSFTAPSAGNYSFKVTDFSGAGDLVLYTASSCPAATPGTPVVVGTCQNAANRNAAQASEHIICQAMTAGQQVFIFVDEPAASATTTFKIEVTQCQRELEANNTPATANPFLFGIEGSINPGNDVDFFSLGTTIPGQRVFALVDGGAANGSNFDLRVTTTTDTLEYDNNNADAVFGATAPAIGGTPVTGTSTFLLVNSNGATQREPYRIYGVVEPPGANTIAACPAQTTSAIDETEPNNTRGNANSSPLGYFEGAISSATDIDIYSFSASAGDLIFMSLDADPCRNNTPFDAALGLLNSSGQLLVVDDTASTSDPTPGTGSLASTTPNSPAEALAYRIQTNGTYYAAVTGVSSATGDYLLAISKNGFAATGPTAAGATISGQISAADGTPLSGVSVSLSGSKSAHTITDSLGHYSFNGLSVGEFYTVTPARANYSFAPSSRSISLNSETTDAGFNASADAVATTNAIDSADFFVRQHYLDFLDREPDEGGLQYWEAQIALCNADAACTGARRIDVSAAYFMSDEFQQTGSFVYGLYKGSLGRNPRFAEFMPDRSRISVGDSLEQSKQALAENWVTRSEFKSAYPDSMTNADFVNKLFDAAGLGGYASERQSYISQLDGGGTRAQVLKGIIGSDGFRMKEYNNAFVLMEYFGYLRRDPDEAGLQFWLNVLDNREPQNYRGMVCSFITSAEYQKRFSPVVTRSNAECGQ